MSDDFKYPDSDAVTVTDDAANAAYIRYSSNVVAKTVEVELPNSCMGLVDIDHDGKVVGIEVIGMRQFMPIALERMRIIPERQELGIVT